MLLSIGSNEDSAILQYKLTRYTYCLIEKDIKTILCIEKDKETVYIQCLYGKHRYIGKFIDIVLKDIKNMSSIIFMYTEQENINIMAQKAGFMHNMLSMKGDI